MLDIILGNHLFTGKSPLFSIEAEDSATSATLDNLVIVDIDTKNGSNSKSRRKRELQLPNLTPNANSSFNSLVCWKKVYLIPYNSSNQYEHLLMDLKHFTKYHVGVDACRNGNGIPDRHFSYLTHFILYFIRYKFINSLQ